MKNSRFVLCTGIALLALTMYVSCKKNNTVTKEKTLTSDIVVNASTTGAIPNDNIDDTKAIQKAIDSVAASGGGSVVLNSGDYNVNPDTSIWLKSNVTLSMASTAKLIAKASNQSRYYVIKCIKIRNAKIIGGQIIGDRDTHIGTSGEWGMGIGLYECDTMLIKNIQISKCWGDGIVVGARSAFSAPGASKNVTILNVVSTNNRRQGLSIGKVNGVWVDSSSFTNTNGTPPQDGIDIEPDADTAQNISIQHCELGNNVGNGVEIYENANSVIKNVTIRYNNIHHNAYAGYIQRAENVTFTDNTIANITYNPKVVQVNCVNCTIVY